MKNTIYAYIGQAELYGLTGATTHWVFGQHITAFNKFLERYKLSHLKVIRLVFWTMQKHIKVYKTTECVLLNKQKTTLIVLWLTRADSRGQSQWVPLYRRQTNT